MVKVKRILQVAAICMCMICAAIVGFSCTREYSNDLKPVHISDLYGRAEKFFMVPYGEAEESVSFLKELHGGYTGQYSFTIDEEGNFYFLDREGDSIKVYSSEGKFLKAISLEIGHTHSVKDIVKVQNYVIAWLESGDVYVFDENKPEDYYLMDYIAPHQFSGLYSVGHEVYARGEDQRAVIPEAGLADLMSQGVLGQDSAQEKVISGVSFEYTDEEVLVTDASESLQELKEQYSYVLQSLMTTNGNGYCLKKVEDIVYIFWSEFILSESAPNAIENRISKMRNGKVIAHALPISREVYESAYMFKEIDVFEDIVYQVIPEETGLAVYRIPWTKDYETRITEEALNEYYGN